LEAAFWFFLVVLGFGLMLVGAVLGSVIALRIRRFRGHKLTGVFLAVLMPLWSLLMAVTVFHVLRHHGVIIVATSPVLLLAVPALVARGSVLLIRTHHI
jgi:drug/metabolite transporter (DMT)-like permease